MARIYYMQDEKRYAFAMHAKGHSYTQVQQMMRERFGRAPSLAGIGKMINGIRESAGMPSASTQFPSAMRQRVIRMAASGEYRTSLEIRAVLELDYERVPTGQAICTWVRAAGLSLESMHNGGKVSYGDEAEAMLVALYTQGEMMDTIRAKLAHLLGKRPSRAWCYKVLRQRGVRRQYQGKKAMRAIVTRQDVEESASDTPFLVRDWEKAEAATARMIRQNPGCTWSEQVAEARARQARRVAA